MSEEPKNEYYVSTPGALRDFEKSGIWQDFLTEINGAIELHRDELEQVQDFISMTRLQETINAIRHLKEMPRVIREKIEEGKLAEEVKMETVDEPDGFKRTF